MSNLLLLSSSSIKVISKALQPAEVSSMGATNLLVRKGPFILLNGSSRSIGSFRWSSAFKRRHFSQQAARGSTVRRANLVLGDHVREALANGEPVVALESTVITHGLPEPQNLELALALERQVAGFTGGSSIVDNHANGGPSASLSRREENQSQQRLPQSGNQVTPATVGIIQGQLIVGLSSDQIEYLATSHRSKPIKASRRDIPIAMGLGLSAGTTVAGTMAIVCSLNRRTHISFAGSGGYLPPSADSSLSGSLSSSSSSFTSGPLIKVFATGGTGGVHQGGESSMDISADLYEFARSPMGVVSSGFKSFLDTRRSLEFLETMGCTVISLPANFHPNPTGVNSAANGQCGPKYFPGFYTSANRENIVSPWQVGNLDEAANILFHCLEGPLANGRASLIAVPIPKVFSMDQELEILDKALASVSDKFDRRADLAGKAKTPLMLEQLNRATAGKTLRANIELLKNNASAGAQLAWRYARLANRVGAMLAPDFHEKTDLAPEFGDRNSGTNGSSVTGGSCCPRTRAKVRQATGSGVPWSAEAGGQSGQSADSCSPLAAGSWKMDDRCANREFAWRRRQQRSPVIVGCTMIDMHVNTRIDDRFKNNPPNSGITFEGRPHLTLGGVGRNLATAIQFLGHEPTFITSLAQDKLGSFALRELQDIGFTREKLCVNLFKGINSEQPPSSCFALVLMDSIGGQCQYLIANLEASQAIDREAIELNSNLIQQSPLVVMDANLTAETIECTIELCHQAKVPIFLEPTDVVALPRLVGCFKRLQVEQPASLGSLLCLSPNLVELARMIELFEGGQSGTNVAQLSPDQIRLMAERLMSVHLPQLRCLLVTMDKRGVLVAARTDAAQELEQLRLMGDAGVDGAQKGTLRIKKFKPPKLITSPVSAAGAGDSFAAGFISGILMDSTLAESLERGFKASLLTLCDIDTISNKLKEL